MKARFIPTRVVPDKTLPIRYQSCAGWLVFDTANPTNRHRLCLTKAEAVQHCEQLNTVGPAVDCEVQS